MIAFMLGFGAYWGYGQYQSFLNKDEVAKEENKTIPASVDSNTVYPTGILAPTESQSKGNISGVLGFPSEQIPPLEVYAFNSLDQSKYYMIKTYENQATFVIKDIDPGEYFVVAYPVENDLNNSGGYSQMVPCGLSVECTNHSLIPVKVNPGATTTGIEVRDWYAPSGTFPLKP